MTEHINIAALLGSRICHDLISPIGAIGNGVELLMMEGNGIGPELALISESVASANARIRFFRIAYGLCTGDQRIGRTELLAILSDATQGGRVSINWQVETDILRREAKLAFLAIQCLETALAFGGSVIVRKEDNKWVLTAKADRLKVDPDLWEYLSNPSTTTDLTPAQVQFALLSDEIARQAFRLTVDIRETEIRIFF